MNYITVMLAFANALSFFLEEDEGIIVQAEIDKDEMHKFLVFKKEKTMRCIFADDFEEEVGSKIKVTLYQNKIDAIIASAESGGEFSVDNDYDDE